MKRSRVKPESGSKPKAREPNAPGAAAAGMIPLSVPEIRGNEWKYIKDCLDTGWVSSVGRYVDRFEQAFADYTGGHAVACVNGTAALHTALLIAGIQRDQEVILPGFTFVAPANAVRYAGAWPVFIDVDPLHWQIDGQKLNDFLLKECSWQNGQLVNRRTRRTIRAILPVHNLGHPVDMDPLLELARRFQLTVIEDCAESLGSLYKGRRTGSLGDVACFSFNGNKIITTGGGGMIATAQAKWAKEARYLTTQAKDDPVEYIHERVGFNYRLSNIQAAMGLAQMECLDEFLKNKERIAAAYRQGLRDVAGIGFQQTAGWARPNHWLAVMTVDDGRFGRDSRRLLQILRTKGIQTRPAWFPLHRLRPFKTCQAYEIAVANQLHERCLCLPSSVGLTPDQQERIVFEIKQAQTKAKGSAQQKVRV